MSGVEGVSGKKPISLKGNNYSFVDARELVFKLLNSAKGVIKEDITSEKLYGMITQSYKV